MNSRVSGQCSYTIDYRTSDFIQAQGCPRRRQPWYFLLFHIIHTGV